MSGVPFADRAGDTLRHWLGLDRATFYDPEVVAILRIGLCYPGRRPGGDLPPRPECAPRWHEPLRALMPDIRLTLVLGRHAQAHHPRDALQTNPERNGRRVFRIPAGPFPSAPPVAAQPPLAAAPSMVRARRAARLARGGRPRVEMTAALVRSESLFVVIAERDPMLSSRASSQSSRMPVPPRSPARIRRTATSEAHRLPRPHGPRHGDAMASNDQRMANRPPSA